MSFIIKGNSQQFFNWDRYGLRVIIPKGTLAAPSETCEVAMKALVAGPFQIPTHIKADFVSTVYGIDIPKQLLKPIRVEIQHCVDLDTQDDIRHLTFVKASIDQSKLPFNFLLENGGEFSLDKQSGSIHLSWSSLIAIVKIFKPIAPSFNYRKIDDIIALNVADSDASSKGYYQRNEVTMSDFRKKMSEIAKSMSEKEVGITDSRGIPVQYMFLMFLCFFKM